MACDTGSLSALYRGNTRSLTVTITDDVSGLPVDITGGTVEMTIKEKKDDAVATLVIVGTLTDAVNGIATLVITSAQSALLSVRNYVVEVTLVQVGGERYTVFVSSLPVIEPVADPA